MSASHPVHEVTIGATSLTPAPVPACTDGQYQSQRRKAQSALATSVMSTLEGSGKWAQWQAVEPRLAGFASLEEAREGWRRRDERCYQVVAGLTALGSRRGGDDDDAALAVTVLLEQGVNRIAMTLSDVCEFEHVTATVWEEVKVAEPSLAKHAARYLLQRARQRLTSPAAGMVDRVHATSLDQRLGWDTPGTAGEGQDRDLLLAVPEVEDPVEDLADLLTWAREIGVIASEEIDLLVELLAAENDGMAREEAQRAVGERHGVAMRTIRRRRDRAAARLRDAAPSTWRRSPEACRPPSPWTFLPLPVRSGQGAVAFPIMSEQTHDAVSVSEPTPGVVARLLDVVADHSVDHALSDIEQVIARLRADADEAAEAREVLRNTSATVLREALRLRAARIETAR